MHKEPAITGNSRVMGRYLHLGRAQKDIQRLSADIIEAGGVTLSGKVLSKSDRLVGGEMLEIVLPEPKNPLEIVPVVVDDFRIV